MLHGPDLDNASVGKAEMTPSKAHRNFSTSTGRSLSDPPPIALAIGGSDPTGGAGIQADLKTFSQLGVHGLSVVTAVTVQNTRGVLSTNPVHADIVEAQLAALGEDVTIDAIKIGMLTSAKVVRIVSDFVRAQQVPTVLDPVLASSNGVPFLDGAAKEALVRELCPWASIVTPNLFEASVWTNMEIASEQDMQNAALRLIEAGAKNVLVKGGHGDGEESRDLFMGERETEWLSAPRSTKRVHGTGCVLASAIAASLAQGDPMLTAVRRAKSFTTRMIERAVALGAGQEIFQFMSQETVV